MNASKAELTSNRIDSAIDSSLTTTLDANPLLLNASRLFQQTTGSVSLSVTSCERQNPISKALTARSALTTNGVPDLLVLLATHVFAPTEGLTSGGVETTSGAESADVEPTDDVFGDRSLESRRV